MKILEQIEQKVSLSRGTEHVDDLFGGREHPDIALASPQPHFRLVHMQEIAGKDLTKKELLIARSVVTCHHRLESVYFLLVNCHAKTILKHLCY